MSGSGSSGPTSAELMASGAMSGNHHVNAPRNVAQSQPHMLPMEGYELHVQGQTLDAVIPVKNADGLLESLNEGGGTLGGSITGQLEQVVDHKLTSAAKGEQGIHLDNLGAAEIRQPVPNLQGDLQLNKELSARGNSGASQGG